YHQVNPRGVVVLYAPKEAKYNDVVQVLDLLREVGGDRVALATLPGAPQTGPGATTNTDNTDSSVTPSESESKQQPTPARTVNPNEFQLPPAPESSQPSNQ
ncbi:MAG: biopolymer transporter ExbD, partial [Okeania sp. SIO1H6]|nr:biopolymer transporter ExbD [Okeania sp. SIO1H6]